MKLGRQIFTVLGHLMYAVGLISFFFAPKEQPARDHYILTCVWGMSIGCYSIITNKQ